MRLSNKVCVITAAGQGIGRATAIEFAKQGATVWATDINQTALDTLTADHANIHTAYLDVTKPTEITAFFNTLERVDVLFNCAGWVAAGDVQNTTNQDMDRSWNINVMSMYHTIQHALPKMLKQNGGSIINMASAATRV